MAYTRCWLTTSQARADSATREEIPMTAPTSKPGISEARSAPSEFGALIAQFRQRRSLSQGQLARAARLSRTYVYHLETGQRVAPSSRVARALMRALDVRGQERQLLAQAFMRLTGEYLDDETDDADLLDQGELAGLLVRNSAFPAHSLDRMWYISAWNKQAVQLFELDTRVLALGSQNLLAVVFDPEYRQRFRPWEALVRRLLADFKHNTGSLTYL